MRRLSAALVLTSLLAACAPKSGLHSEELPPMPPLPPPDEEDAEPTAGAESPAVSDNGAQATSGEGTAASPQPPADTTGVPQSAPAMELPPLPAAADGGEIPRSTLFAVLADGIGHFLRKVRTEPHLAGGRFVGWRLLVVPSEYGVLQRGDTVLRVNGQSIERPEQFKNVWDSMATSSELVIDLRRAGREAKVRYRIVD